MAKVFDFLRRKEPENYVLIDGKKVRLPSLDVLKKLQDAPLLKKHKLLMKEFPSGPIKSQLDSLNSFLSARSNKDEELQIKRIKRLIVELRKLNEKISTEVNIVYVAYREGDLHIQEMYDDVYSETKDSHRMEERLAGLQETKKKVDKYLSEELGKDKVIQGYCNELYDKALELKTLCLTLLGRASALGRLWLSIRRIKVESKDVAIENWANNVVKTAKDMKTKGNDLTKTMRAMILLYDKAADKQRVLLEALST